MIQITDKAHCCGCAACAQICPRCSITMTADPTDGFLYPEVDTATCIDCYLCERICPELHPYDEQKPLHAVAAVNTDDNVRMQSSSGGVFYYLAAMIIEKGGVVFGARFDADWQVVIDYAETVEGIRTFMGSKYVQARMGTSFHDASKFLKAGRKVLFTGTPCQISALHHYLRKDYPDLLTVDVACLGTPSPKAWRVYLDELLSKGKTISTLRADRETREWRRLGISICPNSADGTTSLFMHHGASHYMKAFLARLTLRPACYACPAKGGRSHADITIADFWGVQALMPQIDDDRGAGIALINTSKGAEALRTQTLCTYPVDYDMLLQYNPSIYRTATPHLRRAEFFGKIAQKESFVHITEAFTRPPFSLRLHICLSQIKTRLLRRLHIIPPAPDCAAAHHIPGAFPQNARIVGINFRNKQWGWKGYHVEIKVKGEKCEKEQK
jgi:ferredoxin